MNGFDLDALMKQAQEMQAQVQKLQQEAASETVSATAGGGMVTVTATAGGEIKEIVIDPKAIDPSDPELLADLITAAVNEALRNGQALLSSKLGEAMPPGLGGLLPGL
jgi:DNA-binding YbaB/EbfC family protein